MEGQRPRGPGERLAGPGRRVYAAGVLTLTEPGPAAAGVVVTSPEGRMLAHRAYYLGHASRSEAEARALLAAVQLAIANGLDAPVFLVDNPALSDALVSGRPLPDDAAPFAATVRAGLAQIPGWVVKPVSAAANLARPVALAPLVEWLPERTRRAENLRVRQVSRHEYEVESASQPGQVYRVYLPPPGTAVEGQSIQCGCPDFQYRGIPCKHLLVIAREAGAIERLFYPEPGGPAIPSGPEETA